MNKMAKMMLMNGKNRREDHRWNESRDERDRLREHRGDGKYEPRNDGRYEGGSWYPYSHESSRDYRSPAEHSRAEKAHHLPESYADGHSAGESLRPMDKETAEAWVQRMQNEDGSTGPHWTMEQTRQVQSQKGIDCDPLQFWAAMNMMYSDYCKAAKKLNINSTDFYACMAEAFLDDKDAQPDKLARYYQFVVKH